MTPQEADALHLARFRRWLVLNKKDIKRASIYEAAGIDASALTHIVSGKRKPRPKLLARLLEAGTKRGFDKDQDYQ